ncbi:MULTISPECIES: N-acetylglucosamine-specific PTS transporter subunit IIBC [unclassified Caulobacter]|uniref:N-acetylglucosamine-specific PTS transporter subunit IIBC n=1 Tax=unclassified Caulobacter TaxID=2648921 RepID=UPI000D332531|nr:MULTISPECIES: N-acetylglucosamine-specific PTS transporter subunit IIBC [unclassified Caulobacter]PTS88141.1 PTS N-acetyl-D-glucosamine transporter [Caulobacter sp. HMWF009]PTT06649.1 PTS N-acetyl-D-glucosamine transporter [Caulobacter sp. HMWF025]
MKSPLEVLQPLGRALMLPIAVLPVAALLLRLGQGDLLGAPALAAMSGGLSLTLASVFGAAGGAIFGNLGLIFAIGVAVGLARENHGAAGLAGVVAYLVATKGADALIAVPPEVAAKAVEGTRDLVVAAWKAKEIGKLSIPVGILSGLIAGTLYNRYSTIKLPEYLAFFGGRRFVPIAAGLAGVGLALVFGFGWGFLEAGVDGLSSLVVASGDVGLFIYGVLNRLLIVTGLHHILNNVVWFILGDFNGATGDLNRFAAGDPTAGAFMSGFFPVMMFGLPAACLAMLHTARPERRKAVGGMLTSLALTSFLTGVTEPIEFSFMFLAPLLYAVHAVLTGLSMVIMNLLDVKLGFGFSAGLFDYVLNFNKATRPLLLIPVGLAYAGVYYVVFRWVIIRFDLKTPGREPDEAITIAVKAAAGGRGEDFLTALGGAANLASVDACTTRLRLIVTGEGQVDEPRLKALGARGIVRPSERALQVVLGPIADQVAGEIRAAMGGASVARSATVPEPQPAVEAGDRVMAERLVAALGGSRNIETLGSCTSRLRVVVLDPLAIDEAALKTLGARGVARIGERTIHVVMGPQADALAEAIRLLPA